MDVMSENCNEDSIVAFKEHVELLVAKAKGFIYELLTCSYVSTTDFM